MSQKRRTKKYRKRKNSFPLFKIVSIGALLGVGVFYLLQVNQASTAVYEINDLKERIKELESKKESLELDVAKSQSITNVSDRLKDLKMVAAEKLEYIETGKAVAVK